MAVVSYPRAVAKAALQAALGGAWIAAGELSPAKRRLARLGAVSAATAIVWAAAPKESGQSGEIVLADRPFAVTDPPPAGEHDGPDVEFDKRKAIVAAGVVGLSVAAMIGRRRLEKRWLTRLTGSGHPHPTRALAVRMAAVEFAGHLALQLAEGRRRK
ncbi:hypothetical protein QLQ12_32890 [Actinoplanes sp. NEAU-A12]|uniref:Uncharacterized protein n=1 Tax=Actinoplanes sandaracinus TaxID=3045177 RepID=A0ABT6WUV5_9ACTN|nr:hypothetical protein [Actinoplanes sandaracinus]MDI6103416.1 hypothetical protein [Actinoplanes sandaracinus]